MVDFRGSLGLPEHYDDGRLVCKGCTKRGNWTSTCPKCLTAGVISYFCSQPCFHSQYKDHHRKWHQKLLTDFPARAESLLDLNEATYHLFMTEGCRLTLTTPRLVLRPVSLADSPRVFDIKREPTVNCYQLYGRNPTRDGVDDMTLGYFLDNFPLAYSPSRPVTTSLARVRYVFAITAGKNEQGKPKVSAKEVDGVKMMNEKGYMGNIAIEIEQLEPTKQSDFAHKVYRWGTLPKHVFRHPSTEQFISWGVHGGLFYEIHPSFWGQGLMTEAVEAVLRYCFDHLRLPSVVLDPFVENTASIKLARRFGGVYRKTRVTNYGSNGRVKQEVWAISRDDWYEAEKGREKGTKERPNEEARDGCRWCQRPDFEVTVSCPRCDWARWCSTECRLADLSFSGRGPLEASEDAKEKYRGGHALFCRAA
ncbi:hypothetical protein BCR35DRAFT_305389 [Leucosporidium creatinivorum]|uniref:N-acetyltransferase domain-containing protein n=1 Tax=Leucosporidium creatinivorum TaxID=106004 RepID=A0A1Y2F1A3_9BASI|nr:hypothetical protein BCR35DRAFT_305389 [Leucosporidium creatinivorum]